MNGKVNPSLLTLTPAPERIDGTSLARTVARALRAWKRGARPDLVVTCAGVAVTPEQVAWDALPRESASPSGRNARAPRSVRLSTDREARLAALAERWGVSENEAAGRAIDVAFSTKDRKSAR